MSTCELNEDFFNSKYVDKRRNHIILQSILHNAKMTDLSLWPKLMKALNIWFKVPPEKFEKICKTLRLIQVINNTINDAGDNILTRKGEPTANSKFGMADALNSSYYSLFIVLERVREFESFQALQMCNDYYLESAKAQGIEIYWRDNIICPTEEEYTRMAISKTGALVKLAVLLMQLLSENKSDFTKLIEILSKLVHFYDDYISLFNKEKYFLNKNGLENVSEGKFSLPFIHAIRSFPDDAQLTNTLRQKCSIPEVIKYSKKLLKKFGSLDYTLNLLKTLHSEAREELKKFEVNPELTELLKEMLENLEEEEADENQ